MDKPEKYLGNNRFEDVHWLCSLTESELDLLISLKTLVIQRAKVIGHEELAAKFDLKMLRALALVLMEYTKGNIKSSTHISGLVESTAFMDGCSLIQCKLGDILSIRELKACIGMDEKRKPAAKRMREDGAVEEELDY
ncbi:uncharacterized protein LOC107262379 isoform X2 [Ricinus communis]|uniref:uncharacterized protein LOC107262379 isoform X2 n=1 Tax=Ricinus communis TaxID=3988 RepID=UPI000772198B|nr:uncharacterized protein LOC107262379 isoform X2 [Ricinus communis]XP_015583312.1 uncharacterized protein LOC107262379 isoform X2 [Ricinus communis]|eukprot:XP_015583311.1 uncharacterized protein LOC107262379 isoform X2 [Ricinus communis]